MRERLHNIGVALSMEMLLFFSFPFQLAFIVHVFTLHTSINMNLMVPFIYINIRLLIEIQRFDIFCIELIVQLSTYLSVLVIHLGKISLVFRSKIAYMNRTFFSRLMIRPTQTIASELTVALVWIMAALGITYQSIYHERYKLLETCFYVIVGVFPAIVIIDMVCLIFQ